MQSRGTGRKRNGVTAAGTSGEGLFERLRLFTVDQHRARKDTCDGFPLLVAEKRFAEGNRA